MGKKEGMGNDQKPNTKEGAQARMPKTKCGGSGTKFAALG
jgi:hypothetical protein